ncbi:MAG: DUF2147 domain-containing protein [Verrucomicrobiota bacterium]
MKAILAGILLWAMVQVVYAHPAEGVYWMLIDGDGKLQARVTEGELQVQVIAIKQDARDMRDEKNPKPDLRTRRILGMVVMQGFRWDATEQHWHGGTIYDPTEGKTYDAFIWSDPKTGNLQVRGYVMIGWFGRTETFERVTGSQPGKHQAGEPELVYLQR